MISRTNFTRKSVIVNAIAISLLPPNPANAADFKIGNVKQTFPTDALCVSLNPKMSDKAILVDLGNSAWMNINGKDVEKVLEIQRCFLNSSTRFGIHN
jgi:hypothetical protein